MVEVNSKIDVNTENENVLNLPLEANDILLCIAA